MSRPLRVIAREICDDWKGMYFGATPYVDAMHSLNSVDDKFNEDSARSVVRYFLANAQHWRGKTARRVKAELKEMLR